MKLLSIGCSDEDEVVDGEETVDKTVGEDETVGWCSDDERKLKSIDVLLHCDEVIVGVVGAVMNWRKC